VGGEQKGSLVDLCYVVGANDRAAQGAKNSCGNSYSSLGKSIQNALENYIVNKTKACADFSSFKMPGVRIQEENISAEVLFGDTDILVTLHYTLNMRFANNETVRTLADFSYPMTNMRFKQVYELANWIAQADTTRIFFGLNSLSPCPDPNYKYPVGTCIPQGMEVKRIKPACPNSVICPINRYSDIIQIDDTLSNFSIIDRSLVFQFGVTNRQPALDFISHTISDPAYQNFPYYTYLVSQGLDPATVYKKRTIGNPEDYDIIVGKQDSLEIYPYGADPDDDLVTVTYTSGDGSSYELAAALFASDGKLQNIPVDPGSYKIVVTLKEVDRELWDSQVVRILVCQTEDASDLDTYCT
jgi:hypothetical protein